MEYWKKWNDGILGNPDENRARVVLTAIFPTFPYSNIPVFKY
jgi:hypothetical protein